MPVVFVLLFSVMGISSLIEALLKWTLGKLWDALT
jgi:hypothetical protein